MDDNHGEIAEPVFGQTTEPVFGQATEPVFGQITEPVFGEIAEPECGEQAKSYYVYLLLSSSGATYVGATIDLNRRLRQHNKEIKGGACATGIRVQRGETWVRMAHVEGFPDWSSALQLEWKWKYLTRKQRPSLPPIKRRMNALKQLLGEKRSTSKAIPFDEWPMGGPRVVLEDDLARRCYGEA
jgi:predicted GIY-YIG superfamily endonuclease